MAYTFLQAVNIVLKRGGAIKGDAGELASFVDTARQIDIDQARLAWNDLIQSFYSQGLFSQGVSEDTIVLVLGQREYDLAADFETWGAKVMREETDNLIMLPYRGGYEAMWNEQIDPSDFTGQPNAYAINPQNSKVRIDTDPQTEQVGDTYKYLYKKRLFLSAITDTFAFSDTVVDLASIAVTEMWKRYRQKKFDKSIEKKGRADAMAYLTQDKMRKQYG